VFGRTAPLEVEIGSGKGRFLIAAASACPEHDFLGVERRARVLPDLSRPAGALRDAERAHGPRDARIFVTTALAPESVRAFHVYFPDPWPKKRQKKRRLLDGVFLETLASRLERGGLLRLATDHPDYGSGLEPLLATVRPVGPGLGGAAAAAPDELRAEVRAEGRPIWRFLARKV
jgi:tRNA (guanine-N7-)-methyltransferase